MAHNPFLCFADPRATPSSQAAVGIAHLCTVTLSPAVNLPLFDLCTVSSNLNVALGRFKTHCIQIKTEHATLTA